MSDEATEQQDQPKILYVNAYSVSRNYGGPEEGGWWYDSGEPLASIPVKNDGAVETAIHEARTALQETLEWPKESRQGRFSINGGEDFEITVEEHFAKPYPEVTPHYE